jgi:RHS repeat-associated protein
MVALTDPNGGVSQLTYSPSSAYPNAQLPFVIPVISAIANDDGNGIVSSTQYTYAGGYYSTTERDFRGFASARTIGPTDGDPTVQKIEETFYHQGNDPAVDNNDPTGPVGFMKGRPYRVRLLDGNGKLYAQVITTYRTGTAAPHFNPAIQIDTLTCDSGQCDKTVRNKYAYDEFGNITSETEYGDIANVGEARTIVRTFINNQSIWLLGLIASESTYAGDNTDHLVAKTSYGYDGDGACHNPAPSSTPTTGDLTWVSPWTGSPGDIVDTLMGYDKFGNLICKRDSMGAISTIAYDKSFTYITILTNALKQSSKTSYFGVDGQTTSGGYFGKVKSLTDPNGASTLFEYDGLGRIDRQVEADGRWTTWNYVDLGNPTKQNIRTDSAAGLSSWTYFDGLGRPYLKKNTGPDQHLIATQLHYNARGQTIAVSWPYLEGAGQPSFTTTSYDILDRPLSITSPDGVLSRYCYTDWTSVSIDGNNHRIRYSKDSYGRLNIVEEYKGLFSGPCTTDEEVSSSTSPSGATASHTKTLYTFDVRGNLVAITDTNGNRSDIAYDLLNRRTSVSDLDSGTTKFAYDKNGNVTSQKAASGKKIFLSYDLLNRVVQKDLGRPKRLGEGDVRYEYDGAAVFGIGRLYKVTTKEISKVFFYDSEGRVISLQRKLDNHTFTTHWAFDSGDRLHSVTYTSGDALFYSYNGPFLYKIFDNNTVFAKYEGYTATGNPSVVTYGNGVITKYAYGDSLNTSCSNKDSKICSMSTAAKSGQAIDDFTYKYDLAGNVRSVSSAATSHTYVYDERNRLLAEGSLKSPNNLPTTYDDSDVADSWKGVLNALAKRGPNVTWFKGYAYDDLGNMVWNSAVGDYIYNTSSGPHKVVRAGRGSYFYDKDGNMRSGSNRTLTYDSEGRLTGVLTPSGATAIVYDESGQRVKLTTHGVTTTYGGVLEECRANQCSRYVQAGDRIVAKINASKGVIYYGLDYQLSVVSLTDGHGKLVGRLAYGAYGDLVASQGSESNAKRYTSQEFDTSTGLYFYQSRYYDPVLARFVQPDAYVPFASNPQNLNRYAYALNNPATLTDPDGHCPICIAILIGAAIGGTEAAITHQNVWVGIARGAILGAITGGAGDLVQGSSLLTQVGVESAAGAAASSTNAVIFGGDVGQAAIFGAAFGAGSAFIGTVGLHPFDSSGTGALAAGAGIANELTTAGVEGAIIGGTFAGISGRNILEGAESGASDWVVGELQNMAIGHAFGFLASGFGSPRWEKGAFKYDVSWMPGWITFGNVISGSPTGLDEQMVGANGTYRDHEMGHVRQGTLYGRYYPLAAGLSLVQGASWALAKTYWTHENVIEGAHNYGALERADNPYPAPIRGKDPD